MVSDEEWKPCNDPRYKYAIFVSSYANTPQKWFLYHSTELHKRQDAKDVEKMERSLKKGQTSLHSLLDKGFACEEDARLAIERWLKKHPCCIATRTEF